MLNKKQEKSDTILPDALIDCYYCGKKFRISEKAVALDKKGKIDKPFEHIRCPSCLSTRNTVYYASEKKLFAGEMKPISPTPTTPSQVGGVSGGGNNLPTSERKSPVLSWLCIKTNRCTSVAPDALIEPNHGWLCDWCGSWTFGDDASHKPLGLQIKTTKGGRR